MDRSEILKHVARLISNDRNKTYGDPHLQFNTAQLLKIILANGPRWKVLGPTQKESLELICTKLSRIVHGLPHRDHWDDIAGYAGIAAEAVEMASTVDLGPKPKGTRRSHK